MLIVPQLTNPSIASDPTPPIIGCPGIDPNHACGFWNSLIYHLTDPNLWAKNFAVWFVVLLILLFCHKKVKREEESALNGGGVAAAAAEGWKVTDEVIGEMEPAESGRREEGEGLTRVQFFGRLRGIRVKYAGGGWERIFTREMRQAEMNGEVDAAQERREQELLLSTRTQRTAAEDLERQAREVIWRT